MYIICTSILKNTKTLHSLTVIGGTKKAPIGHMDPYRKLLYEKLPTVGKMTSYRVHNPYKRTVYRPYRDVFCPTDGWGDLEL
jgi:hypothetical protein